MGGGCVWGGGGGSRVKLHKLGGGACPKGLKTPGLGEPLSKSSSLHLL